MRPIVLAGALLAAFQGVEATTTYGCWSDWNIKFHDDCMVALTSLITRFAVHGHESHASIPRGISSSYYKGCKASIRTTYGNSVSIKALISSYDHVAGRCQNGWFKYDSWLEGQIQGHGGWREAAAAAGTNKPRGTEADDISNPDFSHNGAGGATRVTWHREESVEQIPLPDKASIPPSSNKRQHTRDITLRGVKPVGPVLKKSTVHGRAYTLRRATGFFGPDAFHTVYTIAMNFPARIDDLINAALTHTGSSIIRTGLAQPNGSTVSAIAVAAQLGNAKSWQSLFNRVGDSGQSAFNFMGDALQDFLTNRWTGAIYHIYDEHNDVIITFILNGVTGTLSSL